MIRTLLIVDDIKTNREILKKILSDEYNIIEACDGREAIIKIKENHNRLSAILLDLVMPNMDGYEVLALLQSDETLSGLPVVVTTGKTELSSEVKALQLGANDYITKPYNSTIIKQRIRNVINLRETAAAVNELQRDRLTGLYNRAEFYKKAEELILSHEAGYYIMSCFNIDNFKVINDQYGTERGDEVLRHVATCIQQFASDYGGICCRMMADNFAMLAQRGIIESNKVEQSHIESTNPPCLKQSIKIRIGRYHVTDLTLSPSAMYDRAALAEISVKGKYDKYIAIYDESMRERLLHEQEIVNEMDFALRDGQFEAWYQPQYNHATGALIGAEALVRWRHPEDGHTRLIPPNDFIPVFERSGFIYELDKYVWDLVAKNLRHWIDENRSPLPVSVNISRYDLFREDFFDVITGILNRYSLPIDLLRLEVTESAFAESPEHLIAMVKRLLEYGFTVEIDDFGSGYSSLNTLKDVPATILKLDMKFFSKSGDGQRGGSIIESVIRMAKWLGMSVIAEGVENDEQADFLKSIGCNYVQGYLYSPPIPVDEYEALARSIQKEERMITLETVTNFNDSTFWDPASIDTLIFNSYVGAACIIEYQSGRFEVLRATEKYIAMLKAFGITFDDALKLDWGKYLDEDSFKTAQSFITTSLYKNEEQTNEFKFINLPGCPTAVYMRSTMRVIATVGDRYLVYCTNENITAQRESERSLRETDEQLKFLNDMAHDLLAQPDIEIGINETLKRLVEYFDGNRAYIFEFDFTRGISKNTYEICAEGVSSEIANLQSVSIERMRFWLEAFKTQSFYMIDDVDALGEDRKAEREQLKEQNIKSLFVVPLNRDGRLLGFIGIDDAHKPGAQINRLVAIGDYVAVMLTRRDLTAKIVSDNKAILSLMNDTPGGFVRMRVDENGGIYPIYFNDGFLKLTNMSSEEFLSIYETDAFAGVHPDDVSEVKEAVARIFLNGEAQSPKYRIRTGGGGFIWVMFFGRVIKENDGTRYLNIYYTDATERNRLEEQQKELLDNLPCGANLFEVDGDKITVVHTNKRYNELAVRSVDESSHPSVYDAIYIADHETVAIELSSAIKSGRDASCDLRIIGDDGVYRPFHAVGRILEKENGKHSLYVTYTPISDETMSYQEMLPVALETMMSSSTDYSFVKNKNLIYICTSRSNALLFGLSSDKDILGKSDYDFLDKATADMFTADDRIVLETGEPIINKSETIISRDGSVHYCQTSKYPLHDSSGAVIGLYGVSRDITDDRETYSQLRMLTDSIPGGIATYQYWSVGYKFNLIYFNDGFADLFGYTRDEYRAHSDKNPIGLVFEEDLNTLITAVNTLIKDDSSVDCIFRVHTKDGGYKWLNFKAIASDRQAESMIIRAVLFDVTERQEATEKLRISEEENRLAMSHNNNLVGRYNIVEKTITITPDVAKKFNMPERVENVPESAIENGSIAQESIATYCDFYRRIQSGDKTGSAIFKVYHTSGWIWEEARFSTIIADNGKPVSAVISFINVTDQLEKEAVYKKWQQSLSDRGMKTFMLYRCNISRNTPFDSVEGSLLDVKFSSDNLPFESCVREYAAGYVCDEDRVRYTTFLSCDRMLASYYRGKRTCTLEYREILPAGGERWLKLSVDLVEYPNSKDIEGYLMYEDIDDIKRTELLTLERAQNDPLTGILNRSAFSSKVDEIIASSAPNTCHALLMLDIDGFKRVNDVFGHGAGDQTLCDIAESLRTAVRRGDLIGRLGGDEFVIFLSDIPSDTVAANKAKQICALTRKSFSLEVEITGSIGISVYPRDGDGFEMLYKRSDLALYHVKGSGKDNYAFYHDDMGDEHLIPEADTPTINYTKRGKKRRMLIVDDNRLDYALMAQLFTDDFIVEKARDGNSALIRLRHYGPAISVILLDLYMPGMDGFAVLAKIQESNDLRSIPVIVVSGAEDRETSLKAIRAGATDYIIKPVDPDLLRLRVSSAIAKADNERLRAQNSYLEFRNNEVMRYKTVLDHQGISVIEHDWVNNTFIYDDEISNQIAGRFDNRSLWMILLSDMVADTITVKMLQEFEHKLALDKFTSESDIIVLFKTPSGDRRNFRMTFYKQTNEFGLTNHFIITLSDD